MLSTILPSKQRLAYPLPPALERIKSFPRPSLIIIVKYAVWRVLVAVWQTCLHSLVHACQRLTFTPLLWPGRINKWSLCDVCAYLVCARVSVQTFMCVCARACVRAYMHGYMCACVCACLRVCVHAYVRVRACAVWVYAYVCMCTSVIASSATVLSNSVCACPFMFLVVTFG